MIRIALDMMGGDNAPSSTVNGVIEFLNEQSNISEYNDSIKLFLVGIKEDIKSVLVNHPTILEKVEIVNASQIVDYKDRPSRIIKTKPDSSMNVSINLLNEGKVDAVVSAGNTGCLLASSFFNLGMIEGIKRPALFAFIPSENGNFLICDVGANSSAKSIHLLQFGGMASIYMQFQMKINQPKIGLLNIGSEENKGND